jgi:small conductance mechanosensitive channel
MRHLIRLVAALLLLLAPTLALASAPSPYAPAPQPRAQISAQGNQALSALKAAVARRDAAREAHLAATDDADLRAAYDAAAAEYEAALEAARAARDASGDNSSELGLAIHEISGDALDASIAGMAYMVTKWTTQAKDWVVNDGPGYLIKFVVFLVILLVFKLLAGLGSNITHKALSASRLKVSDLLRRFFLGLVRKLIFFVGILIALGQVGVDTGPLLAGIGVVGFVVGFALQDTLANFAAGIMILLYRPFDVGNVITAAGETGKIEDMSLVSTTMLTPDNQMLIIPNSSIWGGTIRNITAQATRRVDMTIGVGYGEDLDRTQEVLMEIIAAHPLVLSDPAPAVKVTKLGESSVDFAVRPWSKTGDYWDVYWDLTKAIKQRLDKEGISIPFPQRDLHLISVPEKLALSS